MKKLIFLLLAIPLLVGCDKDDSGNPLMKSKTLPVAVTTKSRGGVYYEYDNQRRIIKMISQPIYPENHGQNNSTTHNISYDNSGRVTKITIESVDSKYSQNNTSAIYTPSYSGEQMVRLRKQGYRADKSLEYDSFTNYHYDAKGRLINLTNVYGKIYRSFEYDEKGNLTKIKFGSYDNDFTYDDTPGICRNINSPFWLLLLLSNESYLDIIASLVNNVIYKIERSDAGDEFKTSVEYTYDENGLPITFRFTGRDYYNTPYTIEYN